VDPDLLFAFHLADLAAAVTMEAFGGRQRVDIKADASVVTATDRLAEGVIRAAVQNQYPRDGVLGEEEGLTAGSSGRVWVIDPIDGTRNFAEGLPMWTTLIALKVDDEVRVGVADAPALEERSWAIRGQGAYLNDAPIHVSGVQTLSAAFVLHASVEEFVANGNVEGLINLTTSARGSRGLADAWGHLLVARGAADVMVEASSCYEWDWAATSVILEEAGGRLSEVSGAGRAPGCRLMATNALLDDQVRAALQGA
jgi:histidinol-phosphatase